MQPSTAQTSLRIRAVWSEPLLVALVLYDCWATDWTPLGVFRLKRKMQRLIWVYTCQNTTFFKITCTGSKCKVFDIINADTPLSLISSQSRWLLTWRSFKIFISFLYKQFTVHYGWAVDPMTSDEASWSWSTLFCFLSEVWCFGKRVMGTMRLCRMEKFCILSKKEHL